MAYGDYGGYAYCNGEMRRDRHDGVIELKSKESIGYPGAYPGFHLGQSYRDMPHGHVVLGDGPTYIGLYKQSTVNIWLDGEYISSGGKFIVDEDIREGMAKSSYDWYYEWVEGNEFDRRPVDFLFPNGDELKVVWLQQAEPSFDRGQMNYYQYARLVQKDNDNIWTGFSGYGVGEGLEESDDHPFNTEACVQTLENIDWDWIP